MLTEESVRTPTRSSTRIPAASAARHRTRLRPKTRLRFLLASLLIVAAIGYMIYAAIQSGSEYFVTASELKAMGQQAVGQPIKIGGRVVEGSVQWDRGSNTVVFDLADEKQSLPVTFRGTVPDTFEPGADVILEGKLGADGHFQATTMMAKCASKYEPAARP